MSGTTNTSPSHLYRCKTGAFSATNYDWAANVTGAFLNAAGSRAPAKKVVVFNTGGSNIFVKFATTTTDATDYDDIPCFAGGFLDSENLGITNVTNVYLTNGGPAITVYVYELPMAIEYPA